MSERKSLTLEELREVPYGKIKDETLRHICDRANEIAVEPPRLDRSAWEPCRRCKTCQSCKSSICSIDDKSSGCYDCDHMENYEPMGFCPWCGRPLTDAAWEMLEKRLEGARK